MISPQMKDAPMLNGGIDDAFPSMGDMMDISQHPDTNMPSPGHSPAVQHSTQMAGDVIPIRPMEASDYTKTDDRAIMGQIKNSTRKGSNLTNVKPMKIYK